MEGYSRGDCVPISTDSTDRGTSSRRPTAADLRGDTLDFRSRLRRPVRLRFHLREAILYSFRIG